MLEARYQISSLVPGQPAELLQVIKDQHHSAARCIQDHRIKCNVFQLILQKQQNSTGKRTNGLIYEQQFNIFKVTKP